MHVRIGVINESFLPTYNNCSVNGIVPRKGCFYPGLDVEILHHLLCTANITYNLVPLPYDPGLYINDSYWTEGLGMILADVLDTFSYTLIITDQRLKSFDFTYPIFFLPYAFVYKTIDESFGTYFIALLKPFKIFLWLWLILIFIFLLTTWVCIHSKVTRNRWMLWVQEIWVFLCFIQGEFNEWSITNSKRSKKLFFISLGVFVMFFSSLYQGLLLVSFVTNKDPLLFSSLQELMNLLEHGDLKIVTETDEWAFFERLKSDNNKLFTRMNSVILKNGYVKVDSKKDILPYLMSGKYVYPTNKDDSLAFVAENCDLSMVELNHSLEWIAYPFRKNSTVVPVLNRVIANSQSMIQFYSNKYFDLNLMRRLTNSYCSHPQSGSHWRSLNLYDLCGPFLVFLCSALIGVFLLKEEG